MRVLGLLVVICMLCMLVPSYAENPFNHVTPTKIDQGHIQLIFMTPKKQLYKDIEAIYKNSGDFENIINGVDDKFYLPENITVKFAEGEGPVYNALRKEIRMSYDFIYYLTTLYAERYPKVPDREMLAFSLRATQFLLYHEIAHALIDMYQVPMVSNEETAADNLAVILALELNPDGYNIVMDSAQLFDLLDMDKPKYDESDYWDEHTLDSQRFYNILCMAYGRERDHVMTALKKSQNKKLYEFIKQRGDACLYQYDQQLDAWSQLLGPYFKR